MTDKSKIAMERTIALKRIKRKIAYIEGQNPTHKPVDLKEEQIRALNEAYLKIVSISIPSENDIPSERVNAIVAEYEKHLSECMSAIDAELSK